MELRHLRYFVAVASEENMRRAADRLHIAQPALTRQIADLELEIGCLLFDRLPRGLKLNAAGSVMLKEAGKILTSVEVATQKAQRASRGEIGYLKLGFVEGASWLGVFPDAIHLYRSENPSVTLELEPMLSRQQVPAIQAEELDGGFCYAFEQIPAACSSIHLRTDRVLAAVPRHYGWRDRFDLRLVDLAGESFVAIRRASAPRYYDELMRIVLAGGLSPRVIQEAVDESTMLSLVSAGIGLVFVNSANEGRKPQSVDFVPVADLNMALPLHFVWRTNEGSPTLKQFLLIARRLQHGV